MASGTPTRRDTARVLPVSPGGEVLLLEELDPAHPDQPYWSSIGGGIEPRETAAQAAVRELREETGLVVDEHRLVGPVHVSEHSWTWSGEHRTGSHTWFAVPLPPESPVSFEHLEADEVGTVLGWRWWTPGGLDDLLAERGPHVLRPPDLPEIMRSAVAAVTGNDEGER